MYRYSNTWKFGESLTGVCKTFCSQTFRYMITHGRTQGRTAEKQYTFGTVFMMADT